MTILFDRVDNLEIGGKVSLKGFPVGEVKHLALLGDSVLVSVELNDTINIPVDSKFIITPSFLGNSQINIEISNKTTYLTNQDTLTGSYLKTGMFDNLLSDSANREKIEVTVDKISKALKDFVDASRDSTTNKK